MSSASAGPPRIRLSIAHLMLWTLGSAIILACFRALSQRDELPEEVVWAQPLYHLAYSLTLGTQVGSVLLLAAQLSSGKRSFPVQPGHWLLLIEGLSALLMFAGYGLFILGRGELEPGKIYLYFALQLPNLAVCTVGYGFAFAMTAKGSPWRPALAICALVHGIQGLFFFVSAVDLYLARNGGVRLGGIWEIPQTCFGPLLAIVVLIASLADWRNHSQRDILAWTGIGAFVGNIILHFAYRLVLVGW